MIRYILVFTWLDKIQTGKNSTMMLFIIHNSKSFQNSLDQKAFGKQNKKFLKIRKNLWIPID